MLEGVCHYLPGHCFSDVDDEGPLELTVGPEHWLAREGRVEGEGRGGVEVRGVERRGGGANTG